ncbi:pyridoxal 5'-phosphate synthase glutaminase subunit PdxT [Euzebya rosea]|uniref:pyridoxal 5'-phosphate synthase glutaminase subunit PdxT n=1 Tax=Euzebya rosea TaxID=2052804 RepID=UPI000D3E2F0D|nr:pyridoxal 5'-phosphate synthase glutaminase subunit PdxT [Euzebya rosea]
MTTTVGVLALQGDVAEHLRVLGELGVRTMPVKHAHQLEDLDGLVIPGGESTTIGKLLRLFDLLDPLRARIADGLGVFGTCAGAILLASEAVHHDGRPADQPLLEVMDTSVRRNAFGRQVDSFEADLDVTGITGGPMKAVFIRAPAIERAGEGVDVLATVGDTIVVCRQGRLLASSFHPELTDDLRLHELFVDLIR